MKIKTNPFNGIRRAMLEGRPFTILGPSYQDIFTLVDSSILHRKIVCINGVPTKDYVNTKRQIRKLLVITTIVTTPYGQEVCNVGVHLVKTIRLK